MGSDRDNNKGGDESENDPGNMIMANKKKKVNKG